MFITTLLSFTENQSVIYNIVPTF